MEEKPLKEVAEVVRSVMRRKIVTGKHAHIHEGGVMIRKRVTSNGIINELDKAMNEGDEKKVVEIMQSMYRSSVFEEVYLYKLPPIDEKYGAIRKIEVVVSSSQVDDDALLHQLLQ